MLWYHRHQSHDIAGTEIWYHRLWYHHDSHGAQYNIIGVFIGRYHIVLPEISYMISYGARFHMIWQACSQQMQPFLLVWQCTFSLVYESYCTCKFKVRVSYHNSLGWGPGRMTLARTTTGSLRSNSQCCRTAAASIVGSSRAGGRHGGAAESLRIRQSGRRPGVPLCQSVGARYSGLQAAAWAQGPKMKLLEYPSWAKRPMHICIQVSSSFFPARGSTIWNLICRMRFRRSRTGATHLSQRQGFWSLAATQAKLVYNTYNVYKTGLRDRSSGKGGCWGTIPWPRRAPAKRP